MEEVLLSLVEVTFGNMCSIHASYACEPVLDPRPIPDNCKDHRWGFELKCQASGSLAWHILLWPCLGGTNKMLPSTIVGGKHQFIFFQDCLGE